MGVLLSNRCLCQNLAINHEFLTQIHVFTTFQIIIYTNKKEEQAYS
jgi:hypothetical protein